MALSSAESLSQPDFAIVRRAQRGDERAFTLLVRAYQPLVFNFVARMVRDRSLAEELTQEIFLRVFQALPGFSFRSKFTSWLLQLTKNRVLDEFRARGRRPEHLLALEDVPAPAAVEARLEHRETVAEIWQAIGGLPDDLRVALLLREVAGLRYAEIADTLDISLATVKWRIFKARERVTLALAEADVAQDQASSVTADRPVVARR